MKPKFHANLMNWKMNLNLQCQMMRCLKDSKITNSKEKKHHQKRKKKKNESIISNKKTY